MAAGIKSFSNTFVWIILGLLIVGLAGFGATNLSGTIRTIGTVGNQTISVDDYARELQREIRAVEAQAGQRLQMAQVQALGLDQLVLARLVSLAALDSEVVDLGLSVGDVNLQQEIMDIQAFQGMDGGFDRDTYRFTLSQAGVSEADFEKNLRAESARTLVQGAIVAGVRMPDVLTTTLTSFISARRSFSWAELTAADLEAPLPAPTEADLLAYYDANPDDFTLPETKRLSYVLLTPEMILDQVQVADDAIRKLYDERDAEFNQPERRLVERLIFPDDASASAAMTQLQAGGTTFEALVQDRGLALVDIDMGDVTADDLEAAADPVFAASTGDVVGPVPTELGPALFRVNGILAARSTAFEDAAPALRNELAGERARRQIEAQAQNIDDLLAGGATLEDLAAETDMVAGQIDWNANTLDGMAAYSAFRAAAAAMKDGDFPVVTFLEDGGIFALRLEEILPPRPEPIEDARARVTDAWTRAQLLAALRARADAVVADLAGTDDFAATGLPFKTENGLTRTAFIDGTPADFMIQVFEMKPRETQVISGDTSVFVVRFDTEQPAEKTPELASLRDSIREQMNQSLSQALFGVFVRDAQIRARAQIDQRALNAVQASFQ
jgi:peptidyl-prolyl cis-trans isomerase D